MFLFLLFIGFTIETSIFESSIHKEFLKKSQSAQVVFFHLPGFQAEIPKDVSIFLKDREWKEYQIESHLFIHLAKLFNPFSSPLYFFEGGFVNSKEELLTILSSLPSSQILN